MALFSDYFFVIYSTTSGTATARPYVRHKEGPYGTAGEPDARPISGVEYDPATEGWIALATFDAGTTSVLDPTAAPTVTAPTINPSTGTASAPATLQLTLEQRQREVLDILSGRIAAYEPATSLDSKVTMASRDAAIAYVNLLNSVPTSATYATAWASNPESILSLTEIANGPSLIASNYSVAQQLSTFSNIDLMDDPWEIVGDPDNSDPLVTYPGVTGATGNRVLQAAQNTFRLRSTKRIPYDPTNLYKLSLRYRRVGAAGVAPGRFSAGIACYDRNNVYLGTVWTFFQYLEQWTFPQDTWVAGVGYAKGLSTTGALNGQTAASPSTLPANTFAIGGDVHINTNTSGGTNTAGQGSTMQLDIFDVEEIDTNSLALFNQGIFGDIQSQNFVAGSTGWRLGPSGVEFNTDALFNGELIAPKTLGIKQQQMADRETLLPEFSFDDGDLTVFATGGSPGVAFSSNSTAGGNSLQFTKTQAVGVGTTSITGLVANAAQVRVSDWFWVRGFWKHLNYATTGMLETGLFVQVRWFDSTKAYLSDSTVYTQAASDANNNEISARVQAPGGARYATLRLALASNEPTGVVILVDGLTFRSCLPNVGIMPDELGIGEFVSGTITRRAGLSLTWSGNQVGNNRVDFATAAVLGSISFDGGGTTGHIYFAATIEFGGSAGDDVAYNGRFHLGRSGASVYSREVYYEKAARMPFTFQGIIGNAGSSSYDARIEFVGGNNLVVWNGNLSLIAFRD